MRALPSPSGMARKPLKARDITRSVEAHGHRRRGTFGCCGSSILADVLEPAARHATRQAETTARPSAPHVSPVSPAPAKARRRDICTKADPARPMRFERRTLISVAATYDRAPLPDLAVRPLREVSQRTALTEAKGLTDEFGRDALHVSICSNRLLTPMPHRPRQPFDLVILDCDGVLVDSETISCQTLVDILSPFDREL